MTLAAALRAGQAFKPQPLSSFANAGKDEGEAATFGNSGMTGTKTLNPLPDE
jgi:hypothetical protein